MIEIKNKIIVVTGSQGLLGKNIVFNLRNVGATVIGIDIKDSDEKNYFKADLTNEEEIKSVVEKILQQHKQIDGWVNNAYPRTDDWGKLDFENESMSNWRKNIDMQLNGYAMCCQQVLNVMKKQNFGSLINMSSIYGINGPDFTVYEGTEIKNPSAYAAVKGGLINLTKYLAAYYGPYNVRVNCVSPGGIFDSQNEIFVKQYNHKVPMKRMGKPEDISGAVLFLISDAANYITGHNLVVDGGWSVI